MFKGHVGVSNGLCEHGSAFIFASTNSDQIFLANSEHFKKTDGEQRALRKYSMGNLDLPFIEKKRFAPSNLADIVQPISVANRQLCVVGCQIKREVASCLL